MTEKEDRFNPEHPPQPEAPSKREQETIFAAMFDEMRAEEAPDSHVLYKKGQLFSRTFQGITEKTETRLQKLGLSHKPHEHLWPPAYQSPEVRRHSAALPPAAQRELGDIARRRKESLESSGENKIAPILAEQQLEEGVLTKPPYCRQGDVLQNGEAEKACAIACFRMIYADLTGWVPDEEVIAQQLKNKYKTTTVNDSIYYGLYQTNSFKALCDKKIDVLDITEADFGTIKSVSDKLKNTDGAKLFCSVSLASQSSYSALHRCMLISSDTESVSYHDPSLYAQGYADKKEDIQDFGRRWASAYNHATLTIAR